MNININVENKKPSEIAQEISDKMADYRGLGHFFPIEASLTPTLSDYDFFTMHYTLHHLNYLFWYDEKTDRQYCQHMQDYCASKGKAWGGIIGVSEVQH